MIVHEPATDLTLAPHTSTLGSHPKQIMSAATAAIAHTHQGSSGSFRSSHYSKQHTTYTAKTFNVSFTNRSSQHSSCRSPKDPSNCHLHHSWTSHRWQTSRTSPAVQTMKQTQLVHMQAVGQNQPGLKLCFLFLLYFWQHIEQKRLHLRLPVSSR